MEQFQKAIRKVRQVQRMRKQRGYAFSQTDESQARVLQAYDTNRVSIFERLSEPRHSALLLFLDLGGSLVKRLLQ